MHRGEQKQPSEKFSWIFFPFFSHFSSFSYLFISYFVMICYLSFFFFICSFFHSLTFNSFIHSLLLSLSFLPTICCASRDNVHVLGWHVEHLLRFLSYFLCLFDFCFSFVGGGVLFCYFLSFLLFFFFFFFLFFLLLFFISRLVTSRTSKCNNIADANWNVICKSLTVISKAVS